MSANKGLTCIAALALLAFVCHAATGSNTDDSAATTQVITAGSNDDNAPLPDFDGDGTVGFGDFVKFSAKFGLNEGDDGYQAQYDLNGDGEIGFADFVIFAQHFGKEAPSPVLSIPDANLRAVIAGSLGKASGASITQAEMATLTALAAPNENISDLTGLEFATNLRALNLGSVFEPHRGVINSNRISNVAPLSGLNSLTSLNLSSNNISDISALSGLNSLTSLNLSSNNISDISALSGLNSLTSLNLDNNNISDISALSGLTSLTSLLLDLNNIADLGPLTANPGLGKGDYVRLEQNPLNSVSLSTHVSTLRAREIRVAITSVSIQSFEVSDDSLTAGQSFTLETTVRNHGDDPFGERLYYYRSNDATIDSSDVNIYIDFNSIDRLEALATRTVSVDLRAPPYEGTYYYVVCIGGDRRMCSSGVRVAVDGNLGGTPDLEVRSVSVSHGSVSPGTPVTFYMEVWNIGTGPAAGTVYSWYLSDDAIIDADDKTLLTYPIRPGGLLSVTSKQASSRYTSWTPLEPGTYYYGICVRPTLGETNTENNCSTGVPVVVEDREGSPDLIVVSPAILDHKPAAGKFRLWATVRNTGSRPSTATVLRYYLSHDATIDRNDIQVRIDGVISLAVDGSSGYPAVYHPYTSHHFVTAPTSPGTYYYGACVDPVPDESDSNNNCSEAVPMNVGVPDLAVALPVVSTSVPLAGQSFALTATVRNQGPNAAGSTTLRYYRSDDAAIDAADTPVGTVAVSSLTGCDGLVSGPGSRLAASGTRRQSISVSAPSSPGTYYYGACVDGVSGEANADNNCSTGVYVRVVSAGQDPFNIELVFVSDFTDARKDVMRQAARHWETIISEGPPAVDFSSNTHSLSFRDTTIVVGDSVDDLRIFIYKHPIMPLGAGGPTYVRSGNPTGLPAVGRVWIGSPGLDRFQATEPLWIEERLLRDLMLHETAHVLGFGTLWEALGLRQDTPGDAHFSGELAIQAFNAAGGEDYSGSKVPVEYEGPFTACSGPAHWRPEVFRGNAREFGAEIMESTIEREHRLSAITIQSVADLGYVVDVSRADPYKLPASIGAAQPRPSSAKPVASLAFDLEVLGPIYVGDEQGRISHTIFSD